MRSALEFAALLPLLLLLLPPALSQDATSQPSSVVVDMQTNRSTSQAPPAASIASKTLAVTAKQIAVPTSTLTTTTNTTTNVPLRAPASATGSPTVPPELALGKALSTVTTAKAEGARSIRTSPTSGSAEPRTTGSQLAPQDPSVPAPSSHNVTTSPVSPEAGSQAAGHTTELPSTTTPRVSPLVVSTSFPLSSQTSPKPPEGQHSVSTGSPVTMTDSGLSTPREMPTTLTPPASSAETQQTPSSVPTSPASPSSLSPSSLAPQPSSPSRTEATTPGGPTSSSPKMASTSRHLPSTPLPTSVVRDNRVSCGPPEAPTKQLLVLNLTRSSPCTESLPEDSLVTLLCQAAKPTFNSTQDQCHVKLAPVLGSQVVAVKEITIKTNLLPHAVFELLKDRWEDLKEEGVRDMQLGEQGPPEEAEDRFSLPLIITIVCMASFLLLVAALYGCCHQRLSHRKDQQRLTEELQTVENGYHDNPTLEVMETSAEMQEKKVVSLNGELGDSWIVPLDNLTKDDLDEEEDTHL